MTRTEIHASMWSLHHLVIGLAERRRSLGMTQAEVARSIGCGQQLVSSWEVGDTLPDLVQLQAYAAAVDITLRIGLRRLGPHTTEEDDTAPNYYAPDGYRYGVMFEDGSVMERWTGRTQRERAQREVNQCVAFFKLDNITLARRLPGEPWERPIPPEGTDDA